LTPPGFFLWGYLKEKVFSHRLQDIEELQARIRQEVCDITKDILGGDMDSCHIPLQQCIVYRGAHLIDRIFKN
jgi:hypothetical protein